MSMGFLILLLSLIPALGKRSGFFVLFWILGSLTLGYEYTLALYGTSAGSWIISFPEPLGTAHLGLNPLSAFFGLVFSLGLPLGMLYGHYYLREHQEEGLGSHLFWLGVMGLSMHGILWIRHTLLFLMLWEVMSLSSFFCVIQDRDKSVKPGLDYLITMQVGAFLLLIGFGLAYLSSGSFDFSTLSGMNRIPLFLLLAGFSFKAGFFPVASWLPQAHPVAPSHVSGIMSGMMIKTGLYGILLLISCNLFSLAEILVFFLIALLSSFFGVIHALAEDNLKRALAFSSIENMGIIGLGICIGLLGGISGNPVMASLGFAGALLHTLFHSLFKPLLFYLSGNVLIATHSLKIDELGGLSKSMPATSRLFLIGVLAISALPVGNGFISEFTIYFGMIQGLKSQFLPAMLVSVFALAAMAFVGALALIAFSKLYSISFLGTARSRKAEKAREMKAGMLTAPVILGVLILVTGLTGQFALLGIKPLLSWFGYQEEALHGLQLVFGQMGIVFGILILFGLLLWLVRRICVRERLSNTWGCGYQKPRARMQYNSLAYTQPLSHFLKPFILIKKTRDSENAVFPAKLEYRQEVRDLVERFVILPVTRLIAAFLKLFSGIHNGKTNSYIAYSLVVLILLMFWVLRFAP
ncbi:MAG: proton-conducting transporter membrane subunit [Candidatus Cloacimonetes bacterium]|nr:proton-conducting transporter membrane subunit [Candidatus Cloacimonadota bacterium]